MLAGMEDPEEAQLLRSNVLEEISNKLLSLATDAASSTLLEQVRACRNHCYCHCHVSRQVSQPPGQALLSGGPATTGLVLMHTVLQHTTVLCSPHR